VVKGNSHFLIEVGAEEGDLGITLAEVVQHDELCIHPHPHTNSLGGGAAGGEQSREKPQGKSSKQRTGPDLGLHTAEEPRDSQWMSLLAPLQPIQTLLRARVFLHFLNEGLQSPMAVSLESGAFLRKSPGITWY
jgi:hypothetical protein